MAANQTDPTDGSWHVHHHVYQGAGKMYFFGPLPGCSLAMLPPFYLQCTVGMLNAVLTAMIFSLPWDANLKPKWYKVWFKRCFWLYKLIWTPLSMIVAMVSHFQVQETVGFWNGYLCFSLAWILKPFLFNMLMVALAYWKVNAYLEDLEQQTDNYEFYLSFHGKVVRKCVELVNADENEAGTLLDQNSSLPCLARIDDNVEAQCNEIFERESQEEYDLEHLEVLEGAPEGQDSNVDYIWRDRMDGASIAASFQEYVDCIQEQQEADDDGFIQYDPPTYEGYKQWLECRKSEAQNATSEAQLAGEQTWVLKQLRNMHLLFYLPLIVPFVITNVLPAVFIFFPVALISLSASILAFHLASYTLLYVTLDVAPAFLNIGTTHFQKDKQVLQYMSVWVVPFILLICITTQCWSCMSVYFYVGDGWKDSMISTVMERKIADYVSNLSMSFSNKLLLLFEDSDHVAKLAEAMTSITYFG